MIRKSNKNLLNWIYEYIIDFTDEKDVSGLTWTSTHDEALKFLHSIPQKERVQRYGFYSIPYLRRMARTGPSMDRAQSVYP